MDHELTWHEWINAFRATLPAGLHPCAQQFVHEMSGICGSAPTPVIAGVWPSAPGRIRERVAAERRFEHENRRAARAC